MPEETYSELKPEDVSSLMRVEKASGPLSPVRRDLYPAMVALQERVNKACEKADVESMDYDLAVDRKRKLVSNIKLVVEYRMNKVASMALRGAMGTLNTIDQLPPEEKQFYEEVLEASKKLWNTTQKKRPKVRIPEIVIDEPAPAPEPRTAREEVRVDPVPEVRSEPEPVPSPAEVPGAPAVPDVMEEIPDPDDMGDIYIPEEEMGEPVSVTAVPADLPPIPEEELGEPAPAVQTAPAEEEPEKDNPFAEDTELVTVRVTETVPPFAGTERDYVLKKDEVVRIPKSLASILIGRSLAVKLNI